MVFIVTGGAGYIGSHMVRHLLQAGKRVVCIDNYENSHPTVFSGMPNLDNLTMQKDYEYDEAESIEAIFHFAALKSVPDSIKDPLSYYENNVGALCRALELMEHTDCKTFIHSSSAAVYGTNQSGIFKEDDPLNPLSPYGRSKVTCENIINDFAVNHPQRRFFILRYFNPYGGVENPKGEKKNLIPAIQEAIKNGTTVKIYGNSYQTPDGSCVRDFIHINDLIRGHFACLAANRGGVNVYNLGSGRPTTVIQVVKSFSTYYPQMKVEVLPPRQGDAPIMVANIEKAMAQLQWRPTKTEFDARGL